MSLPEDKWPLQPTDVRNRFAISVLRQNRLFFSPLVRFFWGYFQQCSVSALF